MSVTAIAKPTANWPVVSISADNNTVTVLGNATAIDDVLILSGTNASDGAYLVDRGGAGPVFDGTHSVVPVITSFS